MEGWRRSGIISDGERRERERERERGEAIDGGDDGSSVGPARRRGEGRGVEEVLPRQRESDVSFGVTEPTDPCLTSDTKKTSHSQFLASEIQNNFLKSNSTCSCVKKPFIKRS